MLSNLKTIPLPSVDGLVGSKNISMTPIMIIRNNSLIFIKIGYNT